VAIEGIDGAGKSTLIKELEKRLPNIHATKEPSGGPIGRLIKDWALKIQGDPYVDALLFAADRLDHYRREIAPVLRNGKIVVCERYIESSIAYQGAAGVPIDFIEYINSLVPYPDLTFVLDIDPDLAIERIKGRGDVDKYEYRDFLSRVREIYLQRAKTKGYYILNANKPINEIVKEILIYINKYV